MEIEEVVIEIRGIASILKSMGYAEDQVRDNDMALDFLSAKLFECAEKITDEAAEGVHAEAIEIDSERDFEAASIKECEELAANQAEKSDGANGGDAETPSEISANEAVEPISDVTEAALEKPSMKYIFPAENAIKPSDQKEDDPSPEPIFLLNDEK